MGGATQGWRSSTSRYDQRPRSAGQLGRESSQDRFLGDGATHITNSATPEKDPSNSSVFVWERRGGEGGTGGSSCLFLQLVLPPVWGISNKNNPDGLTADLWSPSAICFFENGSCSD
ncbi:UNVERIFIED_CONTAM: hypothetical protein FKN15_028435 [Acipenser sinensis]